MQRKNYGRRAFAAVAAVSIIVSGMSFASAAVASEPDVAPTDDIGYQEFVQELLGADPEITSVGQDGEGNIIVAAVDGTLGEETVSLLAAYDNIIFKDRPAMQAHGENDVVGGAGYIVNLASVCSFGFSAWSPTGDPAIITAGHCGEVGASIDRSTPSDDDAPYFPGRQPIYSPQVFDHLGTMGFSQWGGPNGSEGAQGDFDSTDIAVIDVEDPDLTPLPMVTDWTTWESDDLSLSGTPVTGVDTVSVGDQITRSGRSTGVSQGDVVGSGATVIEAKSWTQVCEQTEPVQSNCHWVYGFMTDAETRPGDSGGSFMRGTTAVGVLSGSGGGLSFATDLVNGLRMIPGYDVMLDLDEPAVTSSATVAPGGLVAGTGGAGLTLSATADGATQDVVISDDGTWSFTAPTTAGSVAYDLQIKDAGFNRSEIVPFNLTVETAQLAKPLITAPVTGAIVTGPSVTFAGTAEPGATLTLTGGATATASVAADGSWSTTTDIAYGPATVIATQTINEESATTSVDFSVAPEAPALTSPANGADLSAAPSEITGTALPGATIEVLLNGTPLPSVTLPEARADVTSLVAWSVTVPAGLAVGAHDISATQTINGIESASTNATFTVAAAAVPRPEPSQPGGTTGTLAATGTELTAAMTATALGGALLLTGMLLVMLRRRQNRV